MTSTTECASPPTERGAEVHGRIRHISELRVRGYRSVVDARLAPGRLCALVGESQVGKSNLLAAFNAVLGGGELEATDSTTLAELPVRIEARLSTGERVALEGFGSTVSRTGDPPPVLYLPASMRATTLVALDPEEVLARRALGLLREAVDEQGRDQGSVSGALPAASLVDGLEACCLLGIRGLVLLIEEPELYLRPQAQRYLYRLLRTFAQGGNQVVYTTHSPNLLNVARLDELAVVSRADNGTRALQPEMPSPDEDFRLRTEFDAERSELLLARAALLVEGQTERLALPFAFAACGYDADREGVSIVECGGKANIVVFARVCKAVGIPFVALHDRDRPGDVLNDAIHEVASDAGTVVLTPDFEHVTGLRGRSHKPERAWRRFVGIEPDDLPEPLRRAIERVVELAREGGDR